MSDQSPYVTDAGSEPTSVFIRRQPVELYKILKFEGLASSGAEAKKLIDDGLVLVNGETELRRRRKIVDKDQIQFEDQQYRVIADDDS